MLKLSDLAAKDLERAKRNHDTYKMIYAKVSALITTQHDTGNSSLLYDVPAFVLGRPMFNHTHAVRYVKEKLLKGGFRVEQMGCTLHVSWKTAADSKKKDKSTTSSKRKDTKTTSSKRKDTKTTPAKRKDTKGATSKSATWLDNTPKAPLSTSTTRTKAPQKVNEPLDVRLKRLHAMLHK
jgi:hypothetical protein